MLKRRRGFNSEDEESINKTEITPQLEKVMVPTASSKAKKTEKYVASKFLVSMTQRVKKAMEDKSPVR